MAQKFDEGLEKGIEKGVKKIAKNMLMSDINIEIIASIPGLMAQKIKNISLIQRKNGLVMYIITYLVACYKKVC